MGRTLFVFLLAAGLSTSFGCETAFSRVQRYRESRYLANIMKQYRFAIDRAGWEVMRSQNRAVLSLSRARGGKVVSYGDIRALEKGDDEELIELFFNACRENAAPASAHETGAGVKETRSEESGFYACVWEHVPPKAGGVSTITMRLFVGPAGHPYDYFVTVTHPKDDEGESGEAKRLLESFTTSP